MIDGLILTVGLALPQWLALMAPYLHDHELSTGAKLVSIAYPLGDVLLLAAAIRLTLDGGRRAPAFFCSAGAIILLLASDFLYGLMIEHQDLCTTRSGSTSAGSASICCGGRRRCIRR